MGLGLAACCIALAAPGRVHGQVMEFGQTVFERFCEVTGLEDVCPSTLSVKQLACLIDCLDKKLYCYGKIAVQSPTVFGQNRMTGYRQDYEDPDEGQLGSFELILGAYQRRADAAALTSATSIAAAVQPRASRGRRSGAAPAVSSSSTVAIPSPAVPFSSLFTNAATLIGRPIAGPDVPSTLANAGPGELRQ